MCRRLRRKKFILIILGEGNWEKRENNLFFLYIFCLNCYRGYVFFLNKVFKIKIIDIK